MKKATLIFPMMMLRSTCISTFANKITLKASLDNCFLDKA